MIISKSKINNLKSCPLSFKYKYIDRRRKDTPPDTLTLVGTEIHQLFDQFYDTINIEDIPEDAYGYFLGIMPVKIQYGTALVLLVFILGMNFIASSIRSRARAKRQW